MARQRNGENNVFSAQAGSATATAPRYTGTKTTPAATGVKITHEQIAQRAHELWLKQGCSHGQDQAHWFEAERQLKAELARR